MHEVPFKVLPTPPRISNLPLLVNMGPGFEQIVLHGAGLDRIESLSADSARITLGDPRKGDERDAEIKLNSDAKLGERLTLQMKIKDFEQQVNLTDALLVAGPRPAITNVRTALPSDSGVTLQPGEITANSFVSFALDVKNAGTVSAVHLSCDDGLGLSIKTGDSQGSARLTQELPEALFLAFDPQSVGRPGCAVMAKIQTADNGDSVPVKLGVIVRLPKIDSFQMTDEKASENAYYGSLKGQDLEAIGKVGWDANVGTPVDAIPAPVAGSGSEETLRISMPWPAPSPHAPLYVWLRGETAGRVTAAKW